jgi:hypothetical protein
MTKKVFSIDTLPGIQRDGTFFDKSYYSDGRWVRFQRGRPRKVLGFRSISNKLTGISRGVFVNSEDGTNTIFSGHDSGLQTLTVDNNGVGSGLVDFSFGGSILTIGSINGGSGYTNNTYANVSLISLTGDGTGAVANVTVSANAVSNLSFVSNGSYYLSGDVLSSSNASIGGTGSGWNVSVTSVDSQFTASEYNLWQFDSMFDSQGGQTLLLAHPGYNLGQIDSTVNTAVLAAPIGGSVTTPLKDINGPSPTGQTIEVSGGVCVLHPYVFVYGNNGLIKNCVAGDPFNWNGADANETNASATKVVKGLPVRGGSNSPSGLFWALDSLIRVSYAPTQITVGGTTSTIYWRYDIISTQTSILSSQCVIEYDGIYYWIGVDRFLLYNGVVKEIPNNMNQNYFFDNLNYSQRQKVWATKVPRYGEIWWFYPNGDSTECNDAIIYNIRENTWYDAGTSVGARRSAGYFSQVLAYPVNAGTELSVSESIFTQQITTSAGNNTFTTAVTNQIALGQVVVSNNVTSGATITAIAPANTTNNLTVTISATCLNAATEIADFRTEAGLTTVWQHEYGVDQVNGERVDAIESYFQTSDLGWVNGGPAASPEPARAGVGDNFWLHLERVEPDFLQSGEMTLYVVGRPYAQGEDKVSNPYVFSPTTGKIDMREQRRELRLKFVSNEAGGNYQMGRVLLNANLGDVRGYGG